MTKTHGVVLIGCGKMGANHLNDIYYRDNIQVRGVVDLDPEKARKFMRKYGALSYGTDYTDYLDDPMCDIFIISTYPVTHLEILRNCLKHNKNVLCEKPIATNLDDGREFVRLVKESKSKVLVGHILRHNKTYNAVAEMIRDGLIGKPIIMRMVQNHHTKDWDRYKKLIMDSSPIIDCGVHYIDVMQWFTGSKVVDVFGIGSRTENDIPSDRYNYGLICLKLEDGSIAYYEAGWGNTVASENRKEFIGPKGRIKITYRMNRAENQEEGDLIEYYSVEGNTYKTINLESDRKPTWEQMKHLIAMIDENAEAIPSIDDVFNAFEIAVKADGIIKKGLSEN